MEANNSEEAEENWEFEWEEPDMEDEFAQVLIYDYPCKTPPQ